MARRKLIYEGKAKILYEGPEPGTLVQYFKDDATAFNAEKKAVIEGKGVLNNRLSEFFMTGLMQIGVPTHFIKRLNMREQLIRQVEIIPLEVIVRNFAAGTIAKRLGLEEGTPLPRPIIEFCYKDDALGDPLVSEEHIAAFGWASQQDLDDMVSMALRVNDFMSGLMLAVGIRLVDFKIEIGRAWDNDFMRLILADEISPDSCCLCDIETGQKLSKTCSAVILAIWRMPTPKLRAVWACCPPMRLRPASLRSSIKEWPNESPRNCYVEKRCSGPAGRGSAFGAGQSRFCGC